MTSQAALAFGLSDVGKIMPGLRANIVTFDSNTIRDTATYEDPVAFPVGIEHVLVGAEVVVKRGASLDGARPGRIVRATPSRA
jgi:N-acyl-D-amino-acid deacylase